MTERKERLVTLESVADFIERRVAKKIGAKHYMALARQASKFYPRYARCARAENPQDETKHYKYDYR